MGRSRDFGIPGGPGKGDADRTTNRADFSSNMAEVKFDGVSGLRKVGLKLVKTYGASAKPAPPQDVFAETEGEWDRIPDNDRLNRVVNHDMPVTNDIIRE